MYFHRIIEFCYRFSETFLFWIIYVAWCERLTGPILASYGQNLSIYRKIPDNYGFRSNPLWLPASIKRGIWVYLMQCFSVLAFKSCATPRSNFSNCSTTIKAGRSLNYLAYSEGELCQTSMGTAIKNNKLCVGGLSLFPLETFWKHVIQLSFQLCQRTLKENGTIQRVCLSIHGSEIGSAPWMSHDNKN